MAGEKKPNIVMIMADDALDPPYLMSSAVAPGLSPPSGRRSQYFWVWTIGLWRLPS